MMRLATRLVWPALLVALNPSSSFSLPKASSHLHSRGVRRGACNTPPSQVQRSQLEKILKAKLDLLGALEADIPALRAKLADLDYALLSVPQGGSSVSVARSASNRESPKPNSIYKVLLGAYISAFLFGYHLGVVNAPLELIASSLGFAGSASAMGAVVSTLVGGAFVGSVVGGSLSEALGGIRNALLANALLLAVGGLACAAAPSLGFLLAGRALCGFGIGVGGALVPLFIGQAAFGDPRSGMLGTLNQVCVCTGILASIVAGLPISGGAVAAGTGAAAVTGWVRQVASKVAWWRVMFALGALPAALQAAALLKWATPQPPPEDEDHTVTAAAAAAAAEAITTTTAAAKLGSGGSGGSSGRSKAGWGILLDERYRRAAATGALLFTFQQFSGINAVVFFSTQVFAKAGVKSAVGASALVALTNIAGTLVASRVVDTVGRKPLLLGSFAGMGGSMLLMSAFGHMSSLVQVGGTVGYIACFALGAGPVPSLLLGEAIPALTEEASTARSKAASLAMASHWACNFAVGGWFLSLVRDHGVGTIYKGFGTVSLAAAAFVALAVPETKSTDGGQ